MKHRDHEIVGFVFREKHIELSRKVEYFSRVSCDLDLFIHIGTAAECDCPFR